MAPSGLYTGAPVPVGNPLEPAVATAELHTGLCHYGCGFRARFTVGSETRFYNACARHLAHFVTRLIEDSSDHWFKVAGYDDE